MKKIVVLVNLLLVAMALSFVACTDNSNDASEDWAGNWKMTQDIVWPQTKADDNLPAGTITIDKSNKNKIIIAGGLLNSPTNITASVSSDNASFSATIDKNYTIKGTATLSNSSKITFKFTIYTEGDKSQTYSRTAVKI